MEPATPKSEFASRIKTFLTPWLKTQQAMSSGYVRTTGTIEYILTIDDPQFWLNHKSADIYPEIFIKMLKAAQSLQRNENKGNDDLLH